jgi:hypothetical protein
VSTTSTALLFLCVFGGALAGLLYGRAIKKNSIAVTESSIAVYLAGMMVGGFVVGYLVWLVYPLIWDALWEVLAA